MSIHRALILCTGLLLASITVPSYAQSFAPKGNLDCNGFSAIQKPLKPYLPCSDFRWSSAWGPERGYDNGHYIGHDEPDIAFISTRHHSGNMVQWDVTLPVDLPLPAVQTFENYPAFWFSMPLCDTNSFPNGACKPASDENTPSLAGSAFMELQFYPPGFVTGISCDDQHWCAALNIDSLEVMSDGNLNPNCTEPVNFAFIQRNGVPPGPPGPNTATNATFNPNAETLLMNPGDHLRVTLNDTSDGMFARVEDLTSGHSGFMVASAHNGFQNTDPNTCAGKNYSFRPEFDTARFGNFVPWAVLQAGITLAVEIGHFQAGKQQDSDDPPCFSGPGDLIPGCLGADIDFDGQSYLPDWADGTRKHATSLAIRSVKGNGIGPLSWSSGSYSEPFPIVYFQSTVSDSESTCQPNGVGCLVPPKQARFYPFYALQEASGLTACALVFGNFSGLGINNFGGDQQYGPSNLPWFFGQNSGGPMANPCVPEANH